MSASKGLVIGAAVVAGIVIAGFATYMIDVDQTQEARLPTVDMEVEKGQMPEFNVETGEVGVENETVEVPVPEVEMKEKTVGVPSGLEVSPPEKDGPAAPE